MVNTLIKFGVFRMVAHRFPFLPKFKRYLVALRDAVSANKHSYSQYGEDRFILDQLNGIDLSKGIYVDVGANQPTQISNTYLFYRHGYKGIAIEANPELVSLFRRFRPRDTYLGIGCSEAPGILEFRHATESVLSGFTAETTEYIAVNYLAVLPLNIILRAFEYEYIYLLSIDVEGMDFEVLRGAGDRLNCVIFLLVEENVENIEMRHFIEERGFSFVRHFSHNLLYVNHDTYNRFKNI